VRGYATRCHHEAIQFEDAVKLPLCVFERVARFARSPTHWLSFTPMSSSFIKVSSANLLRCFCVLFLPTTTFSKDASLLKTMYLL